MEEVKNSIVKMYKNGVLFQKIEEILELDRTFIFDLLRKEKLLYRLNKEDISIEILPISKNNVYELNKKYNFVRAYDESIFDTISLNKDLRDIPRAMIYMSFKAQSNGFIEDIKNSSKSTFECFFYMNIKTKDYIENFILRIYDLKGELEFSFYLEDGEKKNGYSDEEMAKIKKRELPCGYVRGFIEGYLVGKIKTAFRVYKSVYYDKEDASVLRILDIDFDDEFEKSISSIDIIYGYKDKKMYEKPYYV